MLKVVSFFIAISVIISLVPVGVYASAQRGALVVKLTEGESSGFLSRFDFEPENLFGDVFRINVSDISQVLFELRTLPSVEYAHQDTRLRVTLNANDPLFVLDTQELGKQWFMPKIEVHRAWDKTTGSSQTVVAVVDTGIDGIHEDLNDGRVIAGFANYCQVENPSSPGQCLVHQSGSLSAGVNSDDNGHGTLVAGLIGAIANNNRGIAGVNWNVKLMPIKVLDSAGSGQASDVAVGIRWAADNGADIINLSIGGPGLEQLSVLQDAITYAFNRGVLVVAASGNDAAVTGGNLNLNPTSPVCMDGGQNMVVGVGATDFTDRKAKFSNYGSNCVDISAPGTGTFVNKQTKQGIVTTFYDPTRPGEHDLYVYAVGTSVATPLVSGTAALMMDVFPNLDVRAIRDRLIDSVDDITNENRGVCGGADCGRDIGKGRLNALKAVSGSQVFSGGTLVQNSAGTKYLIERGLKRLISDFVFNQRFAGSQVTLSNQSQLDTFPTGGPVSPADGTLIKESNHPAVYLVEGGERLGLSLLAFFSRGFQFNQVVELSSGEVSGYPLGDNASVLDGALMKSPTNPAVYILNAGERRLLSFFVYTQRSFDVLPIAEIPASEIAQYPENVERFLFPPIDGTLITGDRSPTVYLIDGGKRRGLNLAAFQNRGFRFEDVTVLPQGEVDKYERTDTIIE